MFSWERQRVALTGATGFIGYHAALELKRHGANLIALVRASSDVRRLRTAGIPSRIVDPEDVHDLARAVAGCRLVIHVAGAVGFSNEWEPYYRGNVLGTQCLLEGSLQAGVRRFVHTSSIAAVGAAATPQALDETAAWNLRGLRVPYVTTKRQAEEAALSANGRVLEVVVVNPASVLGPGDYSGSEFGTLCQRFWKGRIPFHFGGGNNFVDVRDVAAGIRLAAERGRPGERYLLVGENRTYQAFFLELCRAARQTIPRIRLPDACAPFLGFLNDRLSRSKSTRPYLSAAQAALMGRYFFFDGAKARRELGFETRPLRQTLADAHAFWMSASGGRAIAA